MSEIQEEKNVSASEQNGGNHRQPASENDGPKPSPASKPKLLKQKLHAAEQQIAELQDRLLRLAAEFDNYKKRRESEIGQQIANANADLISQILPVVDDLERCLKIDPASADGKNLHQGVELIYKNLMRILENQGVQPIAAVGQPFDPEKHSALMQVDGNGLAAGMVVEEHLKGYTMNERVLRHSQVLVSK
jgi:molecular chaperone GrpE